MTHLLGSFTLCVTLLAASGCADSADQTSPAAAPARTLVDAPDFAWDDFKRSDRNLLRDRLPTGHVWTRQGRVAVIRDQRFVVDPAEPLTHPYGSAIRVQLAGRPRVVSCGFVFATQGTTEVQNAVCGAYAGAGLADKSIQLAVFRTPQVDTFVVPADTFSYRLFSVTTVGGAAVYELLDEAALPPLEIGHHYSMTMIHHGDGSMRICVPPAFCRNIASDPRIYERWGSKAFAQIRSSASATDGKVEFTFFLAGQ